MKGTGDNRRGKVKNYDRWPELKAIYKRINKIHAEDDVDLKRLKKKALKDYKHIIYLAAALVFTANVIKLRCFELDSL